MYRVIVDKCVQVDGMTKATDVEQLSERLVDGSNKWRQYFQELEAIRSVMTKDGMLDSLKGADGTHRVSSSELVAPSRCRNIRGGRQQDDRTLACSRNRGTAIPRVAHLATCHF